MRAVNSAVLHAEHFRLLAEEHERCARDARERHARWLRAGRAEAEVMWRLDALRCRGWRLLADRRWPGTRAGNVDLLAAGPGGVLVVDVKAWAEPRIEGGRLYRGDADAQDDLDKLLAVTRLVEASVAEIGLAPLEVVPVLALAGDHDVRTQLGRVHVVGERRVEAFCSGRGQRLNPAQVVAAAGALERDFPPYDAPEPAVSPVVAAPVLPREVDQGALFDVDAWVEAELAAALAEPLATWMTWLHPEQARFVRRGWTGPARIAGPAGTGKSVVGLHRTAYLAATRPGRVLFVTYVSSLPKVFGRWYARLAPETADRVEFSSLHAWAVRLLGERGVSERLDGPRADRAFDRAWETVGRHGPLGRFRVAKSYWKDEISRVVKGRGLTAFEEYRDLVRVGRRAPLRAEHRAAVWDLYEAYERLLRERGVHDYDDVLALALAEVRREPVDPPYAAVVVDEVQDLTCVGVRLLHAVAGDRPDGLLLIGDATQAVYPGGFTLAEAGVGVVGRSVLLRTNYRNTTEIVAAAAKVGAVAAYDDPEAPPADARVLRRGGEVTEVRAADVAAHDAALLGALRAALARDGVAPGEVALLVPTRALVREYVALLAEAGIAAADLKSYDGRENGRVRVGTFKRAKGLEFKQVFLPRLPDGDPPREPDEDGAAYRERCELHRREVHVGMTRARDALWLGYLAPADAADAGSGAAVGAAALTP